MWWHVTNVRPHMMERILVHFSNEEWQSFVVPEKDTNLHSAWTQGQVETASTVVRLSDDPTIALCDLLDALSDATPSRSDDDTNVDALRFDVKECMDCLIVVRNRWLDSERCPDAWVAFLSWAHDTVVMNMQLVAKECVDEMDNVFSLGARPGGGEEDVRAMTGRDEGRDPTSTGTESPCEDAPGQDSGSTNKMGEGRVLDVGRDSDLTEAGPVHVPDVRVGLDQDGSGPDVRQSGREPDETDLGGHVPDVGRDSNTTDRPSPDVRPSHDQVGSGPNVPDVRLGRVQTRSGSDVPDVGRESESTEEVGPKPDSQKDVGRVCVGTETRGQPHVVPGQGTDVVDRTLSYVPDVESVTTASVPPDDVPVLQRERVDTDRDAEGKTRDDPFAHNDDVRLPDSLIVGTGREGSSFDAAVPGPGPPTLLDVVVPSMDVDAAHETLYPEWLRTPSPRTTRHTTFPPSKYSTIFVRDEDRLPLFHVQGILPPALLKCLARRSVRVPLVGVEDTSAQQNPTQSGLLLSMVNNAICIGRHGEWIVHVASLSWYDDTSVSYDIAEANGTASRSAQAKRSNKIRTKERTKSLNLLRFR